MTSTIIRPSVSPKTITKVTRLFNGTIGDILGELLQNSRRAGASRIDIACCADHDGARLTLADDGTGVADPQTMIALGDSGWSEHILGRCMSLRMAGPARKTLPCSPLLARLGRPSPS